VHVLTNGHPIGGATIVTLVGQLDFDSAPRLHAAFDELRRQSVTRIVVDLAPLTFCDSIGLSALKLAGKYCTDAGGYLRLARPTPSLVHTLTVVGIAGAVPIYRSIKAACAGDPNGLIPQRTRLVDRQTLSGIADTDHPIKLG
jgi:anti-sigma B factor antagonist